MDMQPTCIIHITSIWTQISEECFQQLVQSTVWRIRAVPKVQTFTSRLYQLKWPVSSNGGIPNKLGISQHLPLTQLLQGAVATDLGLHGQLVGRRQLRQVVEGVREGGVAAVVPHAPPKDAPAATAAGTLPAARQQFGPRRELRGVVHTGPTLCREVKSGGERCRRKEWTREKEDEQVIN